MDLWHAGWFAAAAFVPVGTIIGPPWWAAEIIKIIGTLAATVAGVWIGAWLVTRREASVRKETRAADKLYLAVTVSAVLEQFVSECAAVASDDGTCEGRMGVDGRPEIQVKMPTLDISGLDVEWKALEGPLLDQVHSVPRKLATLVDYLDFAGSNYDDDDFFADRQRKSAELGLYAAKASSDLRTSVGLGERIDPDSQTVTWLQQKLSDRIVIDKMREQAREDMWNNLATRAPTPPD